jgi:hypothetical protein
MSANPVFYVDGPEPIVPKHRLVDIPGVLRPGDDPHWQLGVHVWPYPTDAPVGWDPCGEGTYRLKDEASEQPDNPQFSSLTMVGVESCSTFTVHNQDEYKARATKVFNAGYSAVLEEQLISGVYVTAPYLGDANVDLINSGTAVSATTGLAALENAIGDTRRGGLIIADPATVTAWAAQYLVYEDASTGQLRTAPGTLVVSAQGAIGLFPDGEAAPGFGESWAWATGMVHAFVGLPYVLPEDVKQALARDVNLITYRAEASGVVYWDGTLQAAVLIDWSS